VRYFVFENVFAQGSEDLCEWGILCLKMLSL